MATSVASKGRRGETFNERSKGKDVRTSNVIAAKVGLIGFCKFLIHDLHWFGTATIRWSKND